MALIPLVPRAFRSDPDFFSFSNFPPPPSVVADLILPQAFVLSKGEDTPGEDLQQLAELWAQANAAGAKPQRKKLQEEIIERTEKAAKRLAQLEESKSGVEIQHDLRLAKNLVAQFIEAAEAAKTKRHLDDYLISSEIVRLTRQLPSEIEKLHTLVRWRPMRDAMVAKVHTWIDQAQWQSVEIFLLAGASINARAPGSQLTLGDRLQEAFEAGVAKQDWTVVEKISACRRAA